jgi:hypothetical protein
MPTFIHGKSTGVLVDANDLSTYFNSADFASTIDTAEVTSFGSSAKSYITGLNDATLSLSGLYSQDAGGSDAVLNTLLGQASSPAVTVVYQYRYDRQSLHRRSSARDFLFDLEPCC